MSLWQRVYLRAGDECWPYEGPRSEDGYGIVGRQGKAHRLAYIDRFGAIPADVHVLHRCDNPPCCNPAHLFLGTNHDNVLDRQRKGRTKMPPHPSIGRCGEKHWRAKLTDADVQSIREQRARGITTIQLGREFCVNPATISRIARGIWRAAA